MQSARHPYAIRTTFWRNPYNFCTQSVRHPYEIRTKSVRNPCEIRTKSVRNPYDIFTQSVWHPYAIRTTSIRNPYDIRTTSVRQPYDIRTTSVRHPYNIRTQSVLNSEVTRATMTNPFQRLTLMIAEWSFLLKVERCDTIGNVLLRFIVIPRCGDAIIGMLNTSIFTFIWDHHYKKNKKYLRILWYFICVIILIAVFFYKAELVKKIVGCVRTPHASSQSHSAHTLTVRSLRAAVVFGFAKRSR